MEKSNILYYPRLSGIGDMIPVVAVAIHYFNGERFTIVAGSMTPAARKSYSHYQKFYNDIAESISICDGIEYKNFTDREKIREYGEFLEQQEELNVYCLKDSGDNIHGYHYYAQNIHQIMVQVPKYFKPEAKQEFKSYIKKDKLNICFQLRKAKGKGTLAKHWKELVLCRNVDLDKWVNFILWIADNFNVNLIGIGDSNKESPWHISKEEISPLFKHENIHMPAWEANTTLKDDMYFIAESDLFIGAHSGPQIIAWVLGKPSICFDFGRRERGINTDVEFYCCTIFQKINWGTQSLCEMTKLFNDFFENIVGRYKGLGVQKIFQKQAEMFNKNTKKFLRRIQNHVSAEELLDLNKKLLPPIGELDKPGMFYKYSALSYRLGIACLRSKMVKIAILFLEDSWSFAPDDADEYLWACEQLKSNGYLETYEMLLLRYVVTVDSVFHCDNYAKITFYLGSYYKEVGRVEEAISHFKDALIMVPDYIPILKVFSEICRERNDIENAEYFANKVLELSQAGGQ